MRGSLDNRSAAAGEADYVKHLNIDRYCAVIVFVALEVIEFSAYFGWR